MLGCNRKYSLGIILFPQLPDVPFVLPAYHALLSSELDVGGTPYLGKALRERMAIPIYTCVCIAFR